MSKLLARLEQAERNLTTILETHKRGGPAYAVLFEGDTLREPYTADGKYWMPRWGYVDGYKKIYIVKYETPYQAWEEVKALWERHGDALDLNHLQGERAEAMTDVMCHEMLGDRYPL